MSRKVLAALALSMILNGVAQRALADVVTDWNVVALNAIRTQKTSPPVASRSLAMLHAAIFDAVNGIDRSYESYLVPGTVARSASREAAASTAGHDILVALFPAHAPDFDALRDATLNAIKDGPRRDSGVQWGAAVARELLTARAADGADAAVAPPGMTGPGAWVPTPPANAAYLLPQWGFVAPFAMPTSSFFRPTGPPTLDSATWANDFNEVKFYGPAIGSIRSDDQTQIALFWADGAGTETPPGHWNSIAREVAAEKGNSLEQNARLFALLNIAMADAAICAWDAKYTFDFWRPVTAIRNADSDGNPATSADAGWSSLIPTPPFPDYVSGHSTFSGAAATVLARFWNADSVPFATGSDFLPGVLRHFASFSEAADEAALSRLLGGIHFRSANEDGKKAGTEIGAWTFDHYLRPKGNHRR